MGKVIAIITGATGGIGKEFVRQIASEKKVDEVWALARNKAKLDELKEAYGNKIRAVSIDLLDSEMTDKISDMLSSETPVIKYLVNNAGVGKMGRYDEFTLEEISQSIDLNCKVIALLCHICIPYMKKGSRILNISSASSFQPNPYINLYSASKVFVRYYSRALNVEVKDKGIVVTAVCPGWVDTEMLDKERNGKEIHFPGITSAKKVVIKALADARKGKDMSICSAYAGFIHIYSKIMPQKHVMNQWMKGIKDYI